ncbi:hypothetical protein NM208_g4192 [Fusarium decemcellulare]|uniref:Uncharacterized protein n=1 Tax=Fusarium decemcellulare TaxID=57161 RepID=A0ACC1SLI1_9HYPO|nr:hypothetical protein NM208_g4192 [Fusarium decemcellulare]
MDSTMSPRELADSLSVDKLLELVDASPDHFTKNGWTYACHGFAYPENSPALFIKHGVHSFKPTDEEARNQRWAREALQKMPPSEREGIHIPEIYRLVTVETSTIIIMEFVPGKTLEYFLENPEHTDHLDRCFGKIERALKLFLSFPVPEDVSPGPCGGGVIRSPLFKDYESTIEYPTVELLEMHLNKIATWFNKDADRLVLERKLHFVFSDLYEGNFMFTENEDLYVIDFEQANFLPLSFMTYAMIQHHDVCSLKDRFSLPENNLEIMRRACQLDETLCT